MDALVPIVLVILCEGGEYPQLDARGITVFLDRSYDLDSHFCTTLVVDGLDNLSKRTLAEQPDDGVWQGQLMLIIRTRYPTHICRSEVRRQRRCNGRLHRRASRWIPSSAWHGHNTFSWTENKNSRHG